MSALVKGFGAGLWLGRIGSRGWGLYGRTDGRRVR